MPNQKPDNNTNERREYSSKIKDIYIELKDYSFFHGPSEVHNVDRRFIGRKRILDKLREILTRSETQSGAYLITGFRGMGKTSVVNHALNDLLARPGGLPDWGRFLRICLWLFLLSFIKLVNVYAGDAVTVWTRTYYLIGLFFFLALISTYFYKTNHRRTNLDGEKVFRPKKKPWEFFYLLPDLFNFKLNKNTSSSFRMHVQDFFILTTVLLISFLSLIILFTFYDIDNDDIETGHHVVSLIFSFIYLVVFNSVLLSIKNEYGYCFKDLFTRRKKEKQEEFPSKIKPLVALFFGALAMFLTPYGLSYFDSLIALLLLFPMIALLPLLVVYAILIFPNLLWENSTKSKAAFLKNIRYHINYGSLIDVKINLGQDDLRETDVLRLIAKGTLNSYKKWYYSFFPFKKTLWKISAFILIFCFSGLLYYYLPNYNYVNGLREQSGYLDFFPSQALFLIDDKRQGHLDRYLLEIMLNNKGTYTNEHYTSLINSKLRDDDLYHAIDEFQNLSYKEEVNYLERTPKIYEKIKKEQVDRYLDNIGRKKVKTYLTTTELGNEIHEMIKSIGPVYEFEYKEKMKQTEIDNFLDSLGNQKKNHLDLKGTELTMKILNSKLAAEKKIAIDLLKKYPAIDICALLKSRGNRSCKSSDLFSPKVNFSSPTLEFWYKTIRIGTRAFDFFIYVAYQRIHDWFLPNSIAKNKEGGHHSKPKKYLFNKDLDLSSEFHFFPHRLDYIFFAFLFFVFVLKNLLIRYVGFGVRSHRHIIKDLEELNDKIEAAVSQESIGNIPTLHAQSRLAFFSKGRKKSYTVLKAKAIENELISILEGVGKVPKMTIRPKFIFIFDELDKIEPHYNVNISNKEAEQSVKQEPSLYGATKDTRKRQEIIAKMLSNLKHFFNTANARFFFIASREMYDASLADISDRDSSIGSVFHDVVYVDSFFTDSSDNRASDITSMTEQFVTQFLLPRSSSKNSSENSLKAYNEYLIDNFECDDEAIKDQIKLKIIFVLSNFITYLSYRSNGAPKKITSLMEHFVVSLDVSDQELFENSLIIGKNRNSLYLKFSYFDQYRFGFTTYLFTPFLMAISMYVNGLGDKLLVSVSFLMDHLYKFHNVGFAWRNLELTPEIVAINKAPQLREFIDDLIHFLSNNHIKEILSGLYQFKFNKKISSEIRYISKISELESAAFNFTLDESLLIKRHYKAKLIELKKAYKYPSDGHDYIHSIAFVHMVLGELHFYDQEYDDAVLHYMDAIQSLRTDSPTEIKLYRFVLLIRNMLKLGLTYEKKKSYDSAYMVYGKLSSMIIGVREIQVSGLGIKQCILKKSKIYSFAKTNYEHLYLIAKEEKHNFSPEEKLVLRHRITERKYKKSHKFETVFLWLHSKFLKNEYEIMLIGEGNPYEKASSSKNKETIPSIDNYLGFTSDFIGKILEELPMTPQKEEAIFKISIFEGLRLIYQPILARLQLVEKGGLNSISNEDIERSSQEFEFLIRTIKKEEKYLIKGEYYNKVGDILYYKNGFAFGHKENGVIAKNLKELLKKYYNDNVELTALPEDFKSPISAYLKYMRCLIILKHRVIDYDLGQNSAFLEIDLSNGQKNERKITMDILTFLLANTVEMKFPTRSKIFYHAMGNSLTDVADSLICFARKEDVIRPKFLNLLLVKSSAFYDEDQKKNLEEFCVEGISRLEQALFFYFFGSIFFVRAGELRLYTSQLLKLLYIVKDYTSFKDKNFLSKDGVMDTIEKNIVKSILKGMYRSYENNSRPEIEKICHILGKEYDSLSEREQADIHNSIAASGATREAIVLLSTLKLMQDDNHNFTLEKNLISPYSNINKKYNRLHELQFKCKLNYKHMNKLNYKLELDPKKKFDTKDKLNPLFYCLISDSIYCLSEVLKTHKIFGNDYVITTNSALAYTHKKMAFWCEQYILLKKCINDDNDKKQLEKRVRFLIGEHDINYLIPHYHYEMARNYFYHVLQMHNEGEAYKKVLDTMYYLDDDFNDSLLHFSIALERYKINIGEIRTQIDELQKKSDSMLYDYGSYVSHP